MDFDYIFISKLKEITQNKRMAFIIVICLVLGYSFILIFSSKLYEINRRMSLAEFKHDENAWISSHFDEFKEFSNPEVQTCMKHRTDYKFAVVYFTFKGTKYMSNAVEVDKEFPYHYKFESFSYDMFEDNYPKKQIMVSETLSNEYHMDIGDELIIDNSIWTICSIFANEYHNRTIIFPENSGVLENCERFSPISIVQFSKEYLSKHSEITEILENSKFTTLQHREKYTLNSLRTYALFIIIFAVIFIVLSILNCYLVFFANINYKRKIYGIKRTYGASFAICFGDVFIENGIFSLLAFHIACFLVHMFRYNIPSFFYTEVSLTVYGFGIAVVFIITVLYSLLIFKTISNESTIKLLKE